MNKKLDIILPVYFEQKNIERVLTSIRQNVNTPHNVTLVLQDRNDPTIPIASRLIKKSNNEKIIFTKDGVGMLNALKAGFQHSRSPIITVMMSDLSDDARDIDKMVKKIDDGYDLVCASRYSVKGKRIGGPKLKGILSRVACISLRILIGISTNDATNAFKTFKRDLLNQIEIESVAGFEFPLELSVKTFYMGKKIGEVPTKWVERDEGRSKFEVIRLLPQYLHWYFFALSKFFSK